MRSVQSLLTLSVLLAACAPNSEIPSAATDRSIVTVQTTPGASGQQFELTSEANIRSVALNGDVEEAWAALPTVFEALGLPITEVDGNARILASVQRMRRIGGKSPGSFFRCPGPYGNLASSGDVYVSLRAQIIPDGSASGSVLRMHTDATARSRTSASQVQCSSNGSLQKLIGETLAARLENE